MGSSLRRSNSSSPTDRYELTARFHGAGECGPGDPLEGYGCDPDDPATWTQPVIRLGMFTQAPFIEAATRYGCTPLSINWSEGAAGVDLQRWAPSRCGFRRPSIPATPDGTST